MQSFWAKGVLTVGVGFALVLGQGCKRKAVPAPAPTGGVVTHPARRVIPSESGDLIVNQDPTPEASQPRHRVRVEMLRPAGPTAEDAQEAAAQAEERQRQQDARLWQQQEAASQKAQQELNQEVDRSQKEQEQMQAEPRIQDAPGPDQMGLPSGLEALPSPQGIQDAPGPDPDAACANPDRLHRIRRGYRMLRGLRRRRVFCKDCAVMV